MWRWLFHIESSEVSWFPFENTINFMPAVPYFLLAGCALGVFLGLMSRLIDQHQPNR